MTSNKNLVGKLTGLIDISVISILELIDAAALLFVVIMQSFKRRYFYLKQQADASYVLEYYKDDSILKQKEFCSSTQPQKLSVLVTFSIGHGHVLALLCSMHTATELIIVLLYCVV